jgi:hypothetical protein
MSGHYYVCNQWKSTSLLGMEFKKTQNIESFQFEFIFEINKYDKQINDRHDFAIYSLIQTKYQWGDQQNRDSHQYRVAALDKNTASIAIEFDEGE